MYEKSKWPASSSIEKHCSPKACQSKGRKGGVLRIGIFNFPKKIRGAAAHAMVLSHPFAF